MRDLAFFSRTLSAVGLLFLVACHSPQAGSNRSYLTEEPDYASTPPPELSQEELRNRVPALIEKLAILQEPAGEEPIYTPPIHTPRDDPRVVAYDAACELKRLGKQVFPFLLEHLADKRQSVAFRRVVPYDVGLACFCIIEDHILVVPHDFPNFVQRKGADGEVHYRPFYAAHLFSRGLFDSTTVAAWLEARADRTLAEMQVEALDWLIMGESEIGFPDEKERAEILGPLQRERKRIAATISRRQSSRRHQ